MALLDAFVFEPFSVNESLLDSLLLEPDQFTWRTAVVGCGVGILCRPFEQDRVVSVRAAERLEVGRHGRVRCVRSGVGHGSA